MGQEWFGDFGNFRLGLEFEIEGKFGAGARQEGEGAGEAGDGDPVGVPGNQGDAEVEVLRQKGLNFESEMGVRGGWGESGECAGCTGELEETYFMADADQVFVVGEECAEEPREFEAVGYGDCVLEI